MDLDKVEQLEGKITSELDGLRQKIDNMTEVWGFNLFIIIVFLLW